VSQAHAIGRANDDGKRTGRPYYLRATTKDVNISLALSRQRPGYLEEPIGLPSRKYQLVDGCVDRPSFFGSWQLVL